MRAAVAHFAATYAEAREGFLADAKARGIAVESHVHPAQKGAQGEALAMDVALLGRPDAAALLILTSATHGVEGFCGSACQRALLADDEMMKRIDAGAVALLLVHAVNPYGFSHIRRANEDNVDLNRNFGRTAPVNPAYAELHPLLLPETWPPDDANRAALKAAQVRMGAREFQAAVSVGQDTRPEGLFYAGQRPTWSNGTLRAAVRKHGAGRARIGWIDFHTGLGPAGHGEKIFAGRGEAELARASAWYGADVMSLNNGQSASADVQGPAVGCIYEECPGAEHTLMALEYGTQTLEEVLVALRGAHWLDIHPDAPAPLRERIVRDMRDAFYVDTEVWKGMVLGQARVAVLQAVTALAR